MLSLGFSAGLPPLLVGGTLTFWLREAGIDRTTIGFLGWVLLAYGFKWVWAPLVDRLPIPLLTRALGRRRSWLLASQILIMGALIGIGLTDPRLAVLARVFRQVVTPHRWMAAISPLRPLASTLPNPPLSAFAKSPRLQQQQTVKENNYVATRSPEIPQRAKGP